MSALTSMRKLNLIDSIVNLRRQINDINAAIDSGTKKWAGQSPRLARETSAKAMLYDIAKLQDIQGADEWSESHRRFALEALEAD
jgi:hypothetical protein